MKQLIWVFAGYKLSQKPFYHMHKFKKLVGMKDLFGGFVEAWYTYLFRKLFLYTKWTISYDALLG